MSFDKNYLKELVLNDKNFTKILKEASTVNLIYLSFNPTLTKKMINTLFEKNIENINGNLLKNSLCEESKIREFLSLKDKNDEEFTYKLSFVYFYFINGLLQASK